MWLFIFLYKGFFAASLKPLKDNILSVIRFTDFILNTKFMTCVGGPVTKKRSESSDIFCFSGFFIVFWGDLCLALNF